MGRKHCGFLVQLIDGSHISAAEGQSFRQFGISGLMMMRRWEPDGGGIDENGLDKEFVCNKDSFFH